MEQNKQNIVLNKLVEELNQDIDKHENKLNKRWHFQRRLNQLINGLNNREIGESSGLPKSLFEKEETN